MLKLYEIITRAAVNLACIGVAQPSGGPQRQRDVRALPLRDNAGNEADFARTGLGLAPPWREEGAAPGAPRRVRHGRWVQGPRLQGSPSRILVILKDTNEKMK